MFADGGQWVAAVLALGWAGALAHAGLVRRRRVADPAVPGGVLVALGVAVLATGLLTALADRIDDAGRGATRLDVVLSSAAVEDRTPALTAVATTLNVAGGLVALSGLAAAAAAVLLWRGRRVEAGLMAAAPAVSGLTELVLKLGYARPRPAAAGHLVDVTGFSLPSGHALDAAVVLGTLALVLVTALRRRVARAAVAAAAVAAVGVAGAARVYLGVHWATDVLVGWLLGVTWVAVAAALLVAAGRSGSVAAPTAAPTPVTVPAPRTGPWRAHAALR